MKIQTIALVLFFLVLASTWHAGKVDEAEERVIDFGNEADDLVRLAGQKAADVG
jgi:hypothetical protein